MSYEYLKTVRADRARKKAAKEAKGSEGKRKRGRPKIAVEAGQDQADTGRGSRKRKTTVPEVHSLHSVERDAPEIQTPVDPMLKSWRAPEARMW